MIARRTVAEEREGRAESLELSPLPRDSGTAQREANALALPSGARVRLRFGILEVDARLLDSTVEGFALTVLPADAAGLVIELGEPLEVAVAGGRTYRESVAEVEPHDGGLRIRTDHLPEPALPGSGSRVDLDRVPIDPAWALRVPAAVAYRRLALPLCCIDGQVIVACADPHDPAAATFERYVEHPVIACTADPAELQRAIRRVHGEPRSASDLQQEDPAAICDELLHAAVIREASDLHVCPERDGVHIRLRVDGVLEPYRVLPARVHPELLSRIKVLAGMDIAEKRAPQDGRILQRSASGREIHIRVATLPTPHGERATLRLLGIQTQSLLLESLGLEGGDLRTIERALSVNHGLVLATGPTGSGKTTTLYAALRRIVSRRRVNAVTVQEPIEYEAPGITHVEIDPSQKLTFASALRSILRHDPDVILIGEIRDRETADLAIKAALTGHLVLATLHTNSAASAVTRLVDMGVAPYLVAATLRTVIAQRLVRRLCVECSVPHMRTPIALDSLVGDAVPVAATHEPRGCVYCAGRGYAGRSGLFEILEVDPELADRIGAGASERAILGLARARGMRVLREDAARKLSAGVTSVDEIRSALGRG
ncbi:MAG: GspE/PulE family protein [Planctomycetota bacterium]